MRYLSRLIPLSVIFFLAGCAASGPLFQPASVSASNEGKALVYIYRPGNFYLGGRDAYFYIDNKNVADLSSEGYTQLFLNPGTYVLEQKWPRDISFKGLSIPLDVKANSTYFYRFYVDSGSSCPTGNICFRWSLRQVTEQEAKPEIVLTRNQPAK